MCPQWTLHIIEISDIPKEMCGMCEEWLQLIGRILHAYLHFWFIFAWFILQISPFA